MEHNEVTDLLNDLIRINGDRVEEYEKAAKELDSKNANLKILFEKHARQSRQFYGDLSNLVVKEGGRPSSVTTNAGKVYRMWMDFKAATMDEDNKSILAACEFGELAAQEAYEKVLSSEVEIPEHVRKIIRTEKAALQQAHEDVRKYRDMFESVGQKI